MAEPEFAMLAPGEWLDALRELSLCCADDQARDTLDRLHEMNALLLLAPRAAMVNGALPLAPARLKALLAVEALETAAMAMIGPGTGYLLSRSGDGKSLATIVLAGSHREVLGSGVTPALALIGALALSLSNAPLSTHSPPPRTSLNVPPALH